MRHRLARTAALTAVAAVVGLAGTACDVDLDSNPETSHQRHSFELSGDTLTVRAGAGDVRVVPGAADTVDVQRWLIGSANDKGNHDWALSHDTLTLTARCSGVHLQCGGRYQVAVPKGVAVDVRTGAGDIGVTGLRDGVHARTENGDVTLTRVSGTVRATLSAGSIDGTRLRSSDTTVRTRTGDVSLAFATAPRKVTATTSAGDVTIEVPASGTYHTNATATVGDVRDGIGDDTSSPRTVRVSTSTGDVLLRHRP